MFNVHNNSLNIFIMKTNLLKGSSASIWRSLFLMLFALPLFSVAINAQTTVVDIIVGSPDHETLEAAVIAAELDDLGQHDDVEELAVPLDLQEVSDLLTNHRSTYRATLCRVIV